MARKKKIVEDEPKIGHNGGPISDERKKQLAGYVSEIERLEEEKATIATDIRDVYAEAKGNGFDVKAMRTIIRMRKQDTNARLEQETIIDTYMIALGMLADTPLGKAAIEKATAA